MTTPEWSADDFDENGQWKWPCPECTTTHDGYPPGTFGAAIACLRAQAEALGAGHLVDQVDAGKRDIAERRDEQLREMGLIP